MNDANAMLESILLFKQLRRNPLIKDQCLVLFLNKMDLLGLKLSTLNQCFPDYDTSESLDHVLDNWLDGVDDDALIMYSAKFIRDKFVASDKMEDKQVYTHFTIGTETNSIQHVFDVTRCAIHTLDLCF